MKTIFRSSFVRDFKAVRDKQLVARLRQAIEQVENAQSMSSLPHVKQLKGGRNHYRIRIGEYRVALTIEGEAAFVRFLHRKEIYRYFP